MRKWIIVTIAVPLGAWLLARLADRLEARRGESRTTKMLRVPHQLRHQHRSNGHTGKTSFMSRGFTGRGFKSRGSELAKRFRAA